MKKFIESYVFKTPPEDIGDVFVEWEIDEFQKHDRSKKWYIFMVIIVIAILSYSVITLNYLLGIIVLLLTIIMLFQHYQHPSRLPVKIGEDGVIVGRKFIPHNKLASFWIAYNPPKVKNLYFDFADSNRRQMSVPLEDINPLLVREILEQFIEEDLERENEIMEDFLSRKLKL